MSQESMDAAADKARGDLLAFDPSGLEYAGANEVVRWIREHYMDAGYKRLCRILFELQDRYAKEPE